jgi:hypothetical protein
MWSGMTRLTLTSKCGLRCLRRQTIELYCQESDIATSTLTPKTLLRYNYRFKARCTFKSRLEVINFLLFQLNLLLNLTTLDPAASDIWCVESLNRCSYCISRRVVSAWYVLPVSSFALISRLEKASHDHKYKRFSCSSFMTIKWYRMECVRHVACTGG